MFGTRFLRAEALDRREAFSKRVLEHSAREDHWGWSGRGRRTEGRRSKAVNFRSGLQKKELPKPHAVGSWVLCKCEPRRIADDERRRRCCRACRERHLQEGTRRLE